MCRLTPSEKLPEHRQFKASNSRHFVFQLFRQASYFGQERRHLISDNFTLFGKPVDSMAFQPWLIVSRLLMASSGIGNLFLIMTQKLSIQMCSIKNDPHDAIELIAKGLKSWVGVGVITAENVEPHYFINVADLHLQGYIEFAGYYYTWRFKRLGNLCYVIGLCKPFGGSITRTLGYRALFVSPST